VAALRQVDGLRRLQALLRHSAPDIAGRAATALRKFCPERMCPHRPLSLAVRLTAGR
jgi:hypothetical protein